MSCQVYRDKETGEIQRVVAPNGQHSLLYKDLLQVQSNREEALKLWARAYLPSVQKMIEDGDMLVDENGEPHLNDIASQVKMEPGAMAPEMSFLFEAAETPPQGRLTSLIELKEGLLRKNENNLADVRREKKASRGDKVKYESLLKKENALNNLINGKDGLVSQIAKLKKIDTRSPELMAPFIEAELNRLSNLVKSSDARDIGEAREIIGYIRKMGDFSYKNILNSGHPIYLKEELFDEDGNLLLTSLKDKFIEWANRAKEFQDDLDTQSVKILEQVSNNNRNAAKMYGNLTYEQLVNSKEGLKDTNWWDMWVMDITAGILSHNGILPQIAKSQVDEAIEKRLAWAKSIEHRMDAVMPAFTAAMKRAGHTLSVLGIRGIDYQSLFHQEYKDGKKTGNLTEKYSAEWNDETGSMRNRFWTAFNTARNTGDEGLAAVKFANAFASRNNWIKNNSLVVNPALLHEIAAMPEYAGVVGSEAERDAHTAAIKALVGEKFYNKIVDKVKNQLNEYSVQREIEVARLMSEVNVASEADLNEVGKNRLAAWESQNSPFKAAAYLQTGRPDVVGGRAVHNMLDYTTYVPLTQKDGKDSGYYDKKFAEIEKDNDILAFHELVYDATSSMRELFDHDIADKMQAGTLPFIKKNAIDILLNREDAHHIPVLQALAQSFRDFIDRIIGALGINRQDSLSQAKVDINTGRPAYKVNDSFIRQNNTRITQLYKIESSNFISRFNRVATKKIDKLNRFTSIKMDSRNSAHILEALRPYIGNLDAAGLAREYGKEITDALGNKTGTYLIPAGMLVYREAQHQVASEKSFDLPKVIKLYSDIAAQYAARKEVLPIMEIMKQHYEGIKNPDTTNADEPIINASQEGSPVRPDGLRVNANKQFNNWFDRVILNNYGLRKNYGFLKPADGASPEEAKSFISKALKAITRGRLSGTKVYDTQQREVLRKVNEALATEKDDSKIKELEEIKKNLGKDIAGSAMIDSIMNWVRFKGLSWNLSSGISNFVEGQVANKILAASGVHFPAEFLSTITPTDFIINDIRARTGKRRMTQKVAKAKMMAQLYDILQDNTNELQKASAKNPASALAARLSPFYEMKKGEQYNQLPVMGAILKDTQITGKDGTVSNVWDAMEAKYDKADKQWKLGLKDNFSTKENVDSWEHAKGEDYLVMKARVKAVISDTHGDYDNTKGMMAKSNHLGQMALMFKGWMPREFYKRWAVSQDNVLTGVKGFKGRYRSHTMTSGALHGAVLGSVIFGPMGALAGGIVGGYSGAKWGPRSEGGAFAELAAVSKLLLRKMAGAPVNIVARRVLGKDSPITGAGEGKFSDNYLAKTLVNSKFTAQDFGNLKANIQDMMVSMAWMGLLLATKAVLWDDDDEKDDPRRRWHNLLANRFMALASAGAMYVNIPQSRDDLFNMALFRYIEDCGTAVKSLNKLVYGDDTEKAGSGAGSSHAAGAFSKILLPGVFADPTTLGFGNQMSRQFKQSGYEKSFEGPEKEAKGDIMEIKARRKAELLKSGLDEEEAKHQLKEEFPRKQSGQSYQEVLDIIKEKESTFQDPEEVADDPEYLDNEDLMDKKKEKKKAQQEEAKRYQESKEE